MRLKSTLCAAALATTLCYAQTEAPPVTDPCLTILAKIGDDCTTLCSSTCSDTATAILDDGAGLACLTQYELASSLRNGLDSCGCTIIISEQLPALQQACGELEGECSGACQERVSAVLTDTDATVCFAEGGLQQNTLEGIKARCSAAVAVRGLFGAAVLAVAALLV
jgi:hypothetical protein